MVKDCMHMINTHFVFSELLSHSNKINVRGLVCAPPFMVEIHSKSKCALNITTTAMNYYVFNIQCQTATVDYLLGSNLSAGLFS
jgi:hypothetical protein